MLKEWRESHKISQVKLAEMLGVTLRTVSRWESSGYKSKMLELSLQMLDALNSTPAPAPAPAPIPAPQASKKPSPYTKWERPNLGISEYGHQLYMNPGDTDSWAMLTDIAGMTDEEWGKHNKDPDTYIGVLKAAARMYPGHYARVYQRELERQGKKDGDVIDYCE